jgi:hypothetical protein
MNKRRDVRKCAAVTACSPFPIFLRAVSKK